MERRWDCPVVEWIDHLQGQSSVVNRAVWLRPGYPSSLPSPTRSGRRQAVRQLLRTPNRRGFVARGARRIRRQGPARPNRVHRARRESTFRFVDCRFRFRASCSIPAEEGARSYGEKRAARRASLRALRLKWMWRSTLQNHGNGGARPSHEGFLTSGSGAWARSADGRTPIVRVRAHRVRRA